MYWLISSFGRFQQPGRSDTRSSWRATSGVLGLALALLALSCEQGSPAKTEAPSNASPSATASSAPAVASEQPAVPAPVVKANVTLTKAVAATVDSGSPTVAGVSASVAKELRQAGISPTATGFRSLGADQATLLGSTRSLGTHASALGAVVNSDIVVGTLMARPDMKEACRKPAVLEQKLGYVLGSATARALVQSPEAVVTIIESKLFKSFTECDAFKKLASQADSLKKLAARDQNVRQVVGNENFQRGLKQAGIKQAPPASEEVVRREERRERERSTAKTKDEKTVDNGGSGSGSSLAKCCAALASNATLAPSPNNEYLRAAAQACSIAVGAGASKAATLAAVRGALRGASMPASCR